MNDTLTAFTGGSVEFESIEAILNVIRTAMSEILIDAINDIDTTNNSLDTGTQMCVFCAIVGTAGVTISTISARVYDMYGDEPTAEEVRSVVDSVYNDEDSTIYASRLSAAKDFVIALGQYKRGQLEYDTDTLELFKKQTEAVIKIESSNEDYKNELVNNYISNMNAGYNADQYSDGYITLCENLGRTTNLIFLAELNGASRNRSVTVVVSSS